jgi:hypothetical protein
VLFEADCVADPLPPEVANDPEPLTELEELKAIPFPAAKVDAQNASGSTSAILANFILKLRLS